MLEVTAAYQGLLGMNTFTMNLLNVFLVALFAVPSAVPQECLESDARDILRENQNDDVSSKSTSQTYFAAAIASDSPYCARIARDILARPGARIADATIAGLVCMGGVHLQSSGIGGGFLLVHYNAQTGNSLVLNSREEAPGSAKVDMYDADPEKASKGGLAVGVPGAVRGYDELYRRLGGGVPWSALFTPTIQLMENGFRVDEHTAKALSSEESRIKKEPSLASLLINPRTGSVWKLNDTIKNLDLAKTLRTIANEGPNAFYNESSPLARNLVQDLKGFGSIITGKDLSKYRATWDAPLKVNIRRGSETHTLHATPPPGSGALMAFIMRVVANYKWDGRSVESYQVMVEAFKHAYARRANLGDLTDKEMRETIQAQLANFTTSEKYLKSVLSKIRTNSTNNTKEYYRDAPGPSSDHGTAHFSIVGPMGDAISVTTTINKYFGAGIRSTKTGVIFNNHMDAFTKHVKGSKIPRQNGLKPGKRPMSSTTPAIFTDGRGRVRLVIGGAGGSKIPSATTYAAMRTLWLNESVGRAVESPRIHHTLDPMAIQHELEFNNGTLDRLKAIGHKILWVTGRTSVVGIERKQCGRLVASWDPRKPGSTAGF